MINIKRTENVPSSLEIEKVKAETKNNPKSGKHNLEDVIQQLEHDFKKKCYLCETKTTSFEVEHLKSHQGDIKLKFDWNNLFLSCRHCNNSKSTSFDNILDCTKEDVEKEIRYRIDLTYIANVEITTTSEDERVKKIVELLEKCFNGENTPTKTLDSKNIKRKIVKEVKDFLECINDYIDAKEYDEEDEIPELEKSIKRHLNNNSEYVSFKRCIIKYNPDLKQLFGQYIPTIEREAQYA
ncbi:MAG: HNH endonuclease [Terrisporobacter sp.]